MNTRLSTWLKRGLLSLSVAAFAGLTLLPQAADAARMGGGKSAGKQSSNVTQKQAPAAPKEAPKAAPTTTAAPAAAPAPARNKWLGPLAGLAAGLGIAALLSHLGLGGAMAEMLGSMLMIGLVVVAGLFAWRMWKNRSGAASGAASDAGQPAYAGTGQSDYAGAGSGSGGAAAATPVSTPASAPAAFTPLPPAGNAGSFVSAAAATGGAGLAGAAAAFTPTASFGNSAAAAPAAVASGTWSIPEGFSTDDFLHIAKMYFVRLQAAWDARNESDIRTFTTPEMFAEIKLDLVARGDSANLTEVVSLDAQMLGVEEQGEKTLASVRLSGMIRETVGGPAEPFSEVWNLEKPATARASWVLAGIQQE